MAKPANLPRWAETAVGAPDGNIIEPNSGKKDTGFTVGGDVPTSSGLNWLFNQILQWLKWVGKGVPVDADDLANKTYVDAGDAAADGFATAAVAAHAAVTTTHGAVSAPTASRMMIRDAAGRAQVAAPAAAQDIATMAYTDAVSAWVAFAAAANWNTAAAYYTKDTRGRVRFKGNVVLTDVAGSGQPIQVMPAGFRPAGAAAYAHNHPAIGNTGGGAALAACGVQFQPNGSVYVVLPAAQAVNDVFFLDGVSYVAEN